MRIWVVVPVFTVVFTAVPSFAQPTIDGAVDPEYGDPIAEDPADYAPPPARKPQWDLRKLYLQHDADFLYVAFTITGDTNANPTEEKSYIFYIDTTGDGLGATSDAWTRSIRVIGDHKPEYSVNTWVKGTAYSSANVELWRWVGGKWDEPAGTVTEAALGVTGQGTVIEWKISRQAIGNPDRIWVEVLSTGTGPTDNAQDTINDPPDDWNAPNTNQWSTQAEVKCSSVYVLKAPSPDLTVADLNSKDLGTADLESTDRGLEDLGAWDGARDKSLVDRGRDAPQRDRAVLDARGVDTLVDGPRDSGVAGDLRVSRDAGGDDGSGADAGGGSDGSNPGDGGSSSDEGCGCAARGDRMAANTLPLIFALFWVVGRRRAR